METGTMTDGKGNVYNTVKLKDGNWWTAQNWRYDIRSTVPKSGCTLYNAPRTGRDPNTLTTLGLYYEYQKVVPTIPEGWQIPTQGQWKRLIGLYTEDLAALVKGGNSGLNLEIGGLCNNGSCAGLGEYGFYWSQTEGVGSERIGVRVDKYSDMSTHGYVLKGCLNVRLVKKIPIPPPHRGHGPAKRNH